MWPRRLLLPLLWLCHVMTSLEARRTFPPLENDSALLLSVAAAPPPRNTLVGEELAPRAATEASHEPSRCVWAIVACCSPDSDAVRHPCFEILGCPGPFWDSNPCAGGIAGAVIKAAGDYYGVDQQD